MFEKKINNYNIRQKNQTKNSKTNILKNPRKIETSKLPKNERTKKQTDWCSICDSPLERKNERTKKRTPIRSLF